jgi:glucose-6-phosphate 1-dehydrogenase
LWVSLGAEWSHDFFREHLREGVEEFGNGLGFEAVWDAFAKGLFYCPGNIDDPEFYLSRSRRFWRSLTNYAAPRATGCFTCP